MKVIVVLRKIQYTEQGSIENIFLDKLKARRWIEAKVQEFMLQYPHSRIPEYEFLEMIVME